MKLRRGESKNEFISRCIEMHVDEGVPQKTAEGMCYNMYDEAKREQNKPVKKPKHRKQPIRKKH
jgi:hypothetical protein